MNVLALKGCSQLHVFGSAIHDVLLCKQQYIRVQNCVRERKNGKEINDRGKFAKIEREREWGLDRWGRHRDVPRRNHNRGIWLGPDLPLTLGMDQGIASLPVSQLQARTKNQSLSVPKKCALVDCYDDPEPC